MKPGYLGNRSAQAGRQVRLPARLDTRARQKVGPAGCHCSSFTTLRLSVLRPGRKKAARNAPKSHYYRFYHVGVFAAVVAQPIQDMSAMSITHKTVGGGLPCLRCGAVGRRAKHPLTESNLLLPLYRNETLPYPASSISCDFQRPCFVA